MSCAPRLSAIAAPLVAAASLLFAAAAPANAQVAKPFKITGAGYGTEGLPLPGQDPRPHYAIGEATHLGRYYGYGTVRTDSAAFDPETGHIVGTFGSGGPFTFIAANGDKLVTYYGRTDFGASTPGTVDLTIVGFVDPVTPIVQALWVAEFVAQPKLSTGKFAGVTGKWVMIAQSEPFVLGSSDPAAYSWEGEGTLTFPKGK